MTLDIRRELPAAEIAPLEEFQFGPPNTNEIDLIAAILPELLSIIERLDQRDEC
jgi:hypothetical protein